MHCSFSLSHTHTQWPRSQLDHPDAFAHSSVCFHSVRLTRFRGIPGPWVPLKAEWAPRVGAASALAPDRPFPTGCLTDLRGNAGLGRGGPPALGCRRGPAAGIGRGPPAGREEASPCWRRNEQSRGVMSVVLVWSGTDVCSSLATPQGVDVSNSASVSFPGDSFTQFRFSEEKDWEMDSFAAGQVNLYLFFFFFHGFKSLC